MEIEAISGAATVALASTVVFLLIAKTWAAISQSVNRTPSFSDKILHEAAQQFRDEFDRLTRSQSIYLGSALAFILLYAAAYILRAKDLFSGYPAWQLYLQLIFLALATGYAAYRLASIVLARRRISFVRDANVAIGHQLRQQAGGNTRVFHDIETAAGIVDHVIVSSSGFYAINVIAKRPRANGRVAINANRLEFSTPDSADISGSTPIVRIVAKTRRLEKEIRQLLGHSVRVRSVLAIPGWEITEQSSSEHLLVNERTTAIIGGWKENSDHLMSEDLTALLGELTSRCIASA
jgi:hypothetical protein